MSIYRLYVLDDLDRIEDASEQDFPDDVAAIAEASTVLREEHAVEVWLGQRLVARLGPEFRIN
jgi:hypothetical protein